MNEWKSERLWIIAANTEDVEFFMDQIIVLLGPQNSVIKGSYEVYWVSGLVGFSGHRNFSIYGHWILRSCVTYGATMGNIIVPHRSFGYSEHVVYKHFYWFTCCIDHCNTQIVKATLSWFMHVRLQEHKSIWKKLRLRSNSYLFAPIVEFWAGGGIVQINNVSQFPPLLILYKKCLLMWKLGCLILFMFLFWEIKKHSHIDIYMFLFKSDHDEIIYMSFRWLNDHHEIVISVINSIIIDPHHDVVHINYMNTRSIGNFQREG